MKRLSISVAVLTILAILASLILTGSTEQSSLEFPDKLNHRFVVSHEDDDIEFHIEYYKDDTTKVVAAIKYNNGYIRYMHYHPTRQTVVRVLDYFYEDPDSAPRLVTESHLSDDGKRLVKHAVYREDGSIERKGERQEDGKYKTLFFAVDGATVVLEKIFDKKEIIVSEHAFFSDGSTKFITEWTSSHLTTKSFNRGGKPISIVENHYAVQRGVFLSEDGKTAKAVFSKGASGTEIIYFDENGNPNFKVNESDKGVSVAAVNGDKVLYEQSLKSKSDSKPSYCSKTNTITSVTIYDKRTPFPYYRKVEKVFVLAEDGSHPVKMIVPSSGSSPDTTYILDENGTVTGIETDGKTDKIDLEHKVGDTITFDPAMFQLNEFECFQIPEKLDVPQTRTFSY